MAKLISSYCTKVIGENKIFNGTIRVYRDALALLIRIADAEWDSGLGEAYQKSTHKTQRAFELLVHGSRKSSPKYPEFDERFYKCPSYLRRAMLSEALGAVSSYRSAVANWQAAGGKGKEPRLQTSRYAMPVFYRDNMYEENDDGTVSLKLYHKNDWVWVRVQLRKQDVDYIRERWTLSEVSAPRLVKRNRRYALCFAFEEDISFEDMKPLEEQTILAVDLGINTDAVCSVMRSDGTVLARKFINFPSEKDRLDTQLGRARRGQREHGYKGGNLHMKKAVRINEDLSKKIGPAIVQYAVSVGADAIVMEYLDSRGKKPRYKKQRLHMWRKRGIQDIVVHQAHRAGIRVRYINARNTSRLAFDGSGEVTRDESNMALCRFSTGKQYNCDLNASYNIGARYFIRELLKPIPETERSRLSAKVPAVERRTNCTLSTLFSLYAVLSQHLASVPESWPHGGNESET